MNIRRKVRASLKTTAREFIIRSNILFLVDLPCKIKVMQNIKIKNIVKVVL